MSPLYGPSLIPILAVSATLAALSLLRGRRGLAAWCGALVLWALSLLLSERPDTRPFGERLLMVGFFVPAGFLHAVAEDLRWKTRLVPTFYVVAIAMSALGALPQGLFLRDGGQSPGPLWSPMFALAGLASLVPLLALGRALGQAEPGPRERMRYLLLAGALGTIGGGFNVLLTMSGRANPAGLYAVLASLALLTWVVQASRLPEFGRFVDASLRYSALAALLSTGLLLLALRVVAVQDAWSWSAFFLLFLVVFVAQPLLFWARGQLAASVFLGKGDVDGMARALVESEARAEHAERLAELGTLTSAVAHEVRNPLGVIAACAAVLERQGADPEVLADIREQLGRAAHFADDLLEYGRPEPLSLRELDLAAAAEMAAEDVRRALPLSPMPEMTVQGEALGQIDLRQLVRVFGILLENAGLAGAKQVRVRVRAEGEALLAEIEDDGPGVPEVILPRLFQPFCTGRSRQSIRPGTGLGLAIARSVAERHHGSLRYAGRSEALGGARFTLTLPRRAPLPA